MHNTDCKIRLNCAKLVDRFSVRFADRSPFYKTISEILQNFAARKVLITNWSWGKESCLRSQGRHGDVIKWKYFPRYWPFMRGIHRSPVNCSHKGQWRGALMFSFICAWINGWVNYREAGHLRRYRAHYDVPLIENTVQNGQVAISVKLLKSIRGIAFHLKGWREKIMEMFAIVAR